MECISIQGKVVHIDLLTHADKINKIESIFASSRHTADVFLPDDNFYGSSATPDDVERMADILFRWLGIKHRSVSFHVDPNQTDLLIYTHQKNSSQISMGWHALESPLLSGALVAHGIIHHLLIARAKISLGDSEEDEALTDLGTIYAGFSVLILNAFESKQRPLGAMGPQNYASEFLDFCNQQRVVSSLWQPYILPDVAEKYLATKTPLQKLKPFIRRKVIRNRSKRQRLAYLFASMAVIVGTAVILLAIQPKKLSAEMQAKRESISLLKTQVEQCEQLVTYKQQRWDQSDIFIQRQIDADKTRCTSLLNRYNFEVSEFNANL